MTTEQALKVFQDQLNATDAEYMVVIRSKSEDRSISSGRCSAEALFSMLAHAAESDEAVRLAIDAAHQYLQEQDQRKMIKENPGVSLNGLGVPHESNN